MTIRVIDFRKFEKNTLKGFTDVQLQDLKIEIRDVALHELDGKRWIQLPAKPFTKPDGSKGWNYILHFYDKRKFYEFSGEVLKALDSFLSERRAEDE